MCIRLVQVVVVGDQLGSSSGRFHRAQYNPHTIQLPSYAFRTYHSWFWDWLPCHQYPEGTQLSISLSKFPGDVVEILNHCLSAVVKWLRGNKVKLNPDMTEVKLLGKAEIFKATMLPTRVQLTLVDLVKNLGTILGPKLL